MKKIRSAFQQSSKNKIKITIFGKNSTLAKKFCSLVEKEKFQLKKISKRQLNFTCNNISTKIKKILSDSPNIIINFIGKFDLNEKASKEILILNVIPTWEIIKFFLRNNLKKKTTFIVVGSSSFNSPRKNYMLYSSSKSAVNNLVNSAKDLFINTKLNIKIFNPKTFGGKHIKNYRKKVDIDTLQVAKKIYAYIKKN